MPLSWHWTATLEVIGSKRSYALNWCKPNNDYDDNDNRKDNGDWDQVWEIKRVITGSQLTFENLKFKPN